MFNIEILSLTGFLQIVKNVRFCTFIFAQKKCYVSVMFVLPSVCIVVLFSQQTNPIQIKKNGTIFEDSETRSFSLIP